jgi:hypothetical protein
MAGIGWNAKCNYCLKKNKLVYFDNTMLIKSKIQTKKPLSPLMGKGRGKTGS